MRPARAVLVGGSRERAPLDAHFSRQADGLRDQTQRRRRGACQAGQGSRCGPSERTVSRSPTLPEPWLALSAALGGVGELATKLETTTRTIGRWAHGERMPGPLVRTAVNRLAKRYGVEAPFAAILGGCGPPRNRP